MKKNIISFICSLAVVFCMGINHVNVSAATFEEVIDYAYEINYDSEQIQQAVNMYNAGVVNPTSEQCDEAMKRLKEWADSRDDVIKDIVDETPVVTESTETEESVSDNAGGFVNSSDTEQQKDFISMTLDEKLAYINSMPESERQEFLADMTNEEKNSILKQMNVSEQMDLISQFIDFGETLGLNLSVDEVSGNTVSVSVRDMYGNLVNVMTFGNIVENTGMPYNVPIFFGGSAVIISLAGIIWLIRQSREINGTE